MSAETVRITTPSPSSSEGVGWIGWVIGGLAAAAAVAVGVLVALRLLRKPEPPPEPKPVAQLPPPAAPAPQPDVIAGALNVAGQIGSFIQQNQGAIQGAIQGVQRLLGGLFGRR